MILLPEKYNDIELTKNEKLFINMIKNKFDDSVVMLLKINPIGKNRLNSLIFQQGVCFIENLEIDNLSIFSVVMPTIISKYKDDIRKISNKLLMHRLFNDISNNTLKFPVSYKLFISNLNKEDVFKQSLPIEVNEFLIKNCIFKDEMKEAIKNSECLIEILFKNCELCVSKEKLTMKDDALDVLVHMIAPEYTIPKYSKIEVISHNNAIIKKEEKEYNVAQGELCINVLKLDNEQINIINNIKTGHQLILACAGSGKSVLLISKCFKIASIHEDKQFLITCYNKNLNDMYKWRINVAGFRNRNVICCTFHKLCRDLLEESNIYYNGNDFDKTFESARKALNEGKIKRKFYGIFIDEVQVFKSEWYEFCYDLLEKKDEEDYFFIICGDKSQNITKNIKQGKAPWQGNDRLPKFRGKSLRLEKNYRNSIEINTYINRFTEIAKDYASRFSIILKEDEESILRGQAIRQGENPHLIITDRVKEADEVIKALLFLNKKKGIPLSEIAVLMFNKHYKLENYYIHSWIKNKLLEKCIDYCELVSTDSLNRSTYGEREGVTLCTIESALGLDFEAVIICGLKPMGAHYKTKRQSTFNSKNPEIDDAKCDFVKNINTLYTGCTRARDHLFIILTEDKDTSIYSKMLLEANRE